MKLLSFRIHGDLFAVNALSVKEINRNVYCTPAPTVPQHIIGLYNMRGQVVTMLDLACLLGYAQMPRGEPVHCVILKPRGRSDELFGFAVEKAEDVINVPAGRCVAPPANIERVIKEKLSCIYETEQELLLILNEDQLFSGLV